MRFSPEGANGRHKYAGVPFGGGAHMCRVLHFAYMQAKIFFHHVLTTHRIRVADGYAPDWQMWPIPRPKDGLTVRSEEHTSELQSLMRISYAVICLKKKTIR